MILWFHRKERDIVTVYKTPNGDPPKRLATCELDPEFFKDSICFRGFLKATGIRLRLGELQKMDWSKNGAKFSDEVIKVRFKKKKTICDCPKWIVGVVKDVIEELRLEAFIGPPLPAGWSKKGSPPPLIAVNYNTDMTVVGNLWNIPTTTATTTGTNITTTFDQYVWTTISNLDQASTAI